MLLHRKRVLVVLSTAALFFALPTVSAPVLEEVAITPINPEKIVQQIKLSPQETAWLAKKPTIRARVGEFPPYHSFEEGIARGISPGYLQSSCHGFGWKCDPVSAQLDELSRWQQAMLGREDRILAIKKEVNERLAEHGQPPRYASVTDESIKDERE